MFNFSCQSYFSKDDIHLSTTKKKNNNNKNQNIKEKVNILNKIIKNKESINNIDQVPSTEEDELQIIDYPYMNKRISENFFDFAKPFFPSEDTNYIPEDSLKNCNFNKCFSKDIPNVLENNVLKEINKNDKKLLNENNIPNKIIKENENENDDTIKDKSTGVIISSEYINNFHNNLKNYILIKNSSNKNISVDNNINYKNAEIKSTFNLRKNSEKILTSRKNIKKIINNKNKNKNNNGTNLNDKSVKSQILSNSNKKINSFKKYNISYFNANSKIQQDNNSHFIDQKKRKKTISNKKIPVNLKVNKIPHQTNKNKSYRIKVYKNRNQNDTRKPISNGLIIYEKKKLNIKNLIIKKPKYGKNESNINRECLVREFSKEKFYTQNCNYSNTYIKEKSKKCFVNYDNEINLKNNNSEDIFDFAKTSKIGNKLFFKTNYFIEGSPNIQIRRNLNDLYLNTKVLFTNKNSNYIIRRKKMNNCSSRSAFKLMSNI